MRPQVPTRETSSPQHRVTTSLTALKSTATILGVVALSRSIRVFDSAVGELPVMRTPCLFASGHRIGRPTNRAMPQFFVLQTVLESTSHRLSTRHVVPDFRGCSVASISRGSAHVEVCGGEGRLGRFGKERL